MKKNTNKGCFFVFYSCFFMEFQILKRFFLFQYYCKASFKKIGITDHFSTIEILFYKSIVVSFRAEKTGEEKLYRRVFGLLQKYCIFLNVQ